MHAWIRALMASLSITLLAVHATPTAAVHPYPDGGLRSAGQLTLEEERWPTFLAHGAVPDTILIGMGLGGASVVEIGTDPLERLGTAAANLPDNPVFGAVTADGSRIFAIGDFIGVPVMRIELDGSGDVATTPPGGGWSNVQDIVLDEPRGVLYLPLRTTPATLVRVDMDTLEEIDRISMPDDPADPVLGFISMAIDPANEFAYLGTDSQSGTPNRFPHIAKVDLDDFEIVDFIKFGSMLNGRLGNALMSPAGDYAYFISNLNPARTYRLQLSDFTLQGNMDGPNLGGGAAVQSAVISADGTRAYVSRTGYLTVHNLDTMTAGGSHSVPHGGLLLSQDGGSVYIASVGGIVSEFDAATEAITNQIHLWANQGPIRGGVAAPDGTLHFATGFDDPRPIVALDPYLLEQTGAVRFVGEEGDSGPIALGPAGGRIYTHPLAGPNTTFRVVDLATGTFSLLDPGRSDGFAQQLFIDPAAGKLIVSYNSSSNQLRLYDLDPFGYAGAVTAPGDVNFPNFTGFAPSERMAFYSGSYFPNRLHYQLFNEQYDGWSQDDVELADGADAFNIDIADIIYSPPLDEFFALIENTSTDEKTIHRVPRDGSGWSVFATLPASSYSLTALAIDPEANYLYAFYRDVVESEDVFAVSIHDAATAELAGTVTGTGPSGIGRESIVLSPDGAIALAGDMNTNRGTLHRFALSRRGHLNASRVTVAEGGVLESVSLHSDWDGNNVELSIYTDGLPRELLWSSGPVANGVAGGYLEVPVAEEVVLASGDYWFAWQADTSRPVASRTSGAPGDGFLLPHRFGTPPQELEQDTLVQTDDVWDFATAFAEPPAPASTASVAQDYHFGADMQVGFTVDPGVDVSGTRLFVRTPSGTEFVDSGLDPEAGTGGSFVYTFTDGNGLYEFQSVATSTLDVEEPLGDDPEATVLVSLAAGSPVPAPFGAGNTARTFPMDEEEAVTLDFAGLSGEGTATVSRELGPSAPAGGDPDYFIPQRWVIELSGFTFSSATLVIAFDGENLGELSADQITIAVSDSGTGTTQYDLVLDEGPPPTATITGIDAFSTWYLGTEPTRARDWEALRY